MKHGHTKGQLEHQDVKHQPRPHLASVIDQYVLAKQESRPDSNLENHLIKVRNNIAFYAKLK